MFYEPQSGFFYDPKTKLYYGNTVKKYFRYTPSGYPPFVPVSSDTSNGDDEASLQPEKIHCMLSSNSRNNSPETTSDGAAVQVIPRLAGNSGNHRSRSASKEIFIKINTTITSINSDNLKTKAEPAVPLDKIRKEQLGHIAKWQQIKKKPSSPVADVSANTSPAPAINGLSRNDEVAAAAPPIRLGDKVICALCRRKFPDMDSLARHEKLSQLHKDNLAKQELLTQQEKKTSTDGTCDTTVATITVVDTAAPKDEVRYVDRAEKRRRLHGTAPESLSSKWNAPMQDGLVVDPRHYHDFTAPSSLVGGQNIGNQILQKMKAKSSDNNNQNEGSSERRTRNNQEAISSSHYALEKEWSRIETISSGMDPTRRMTLSQNEKWGLGSL
jgi:hypothetical protein